MKIKIDLIHVHVTYYFIYKLQVQWFGKYNKMLANYMRSIGDHGGLDLTQDLKPPKTLYIEVKKNNCLIVSISQM